MTNGLRWTDAEYRAYLKNKNHHSFSPADLESSAGDGSKNENENEKVHSRVSIRIHSIRRRLIDPDGICAKWAIDGLVQGGLLADDSAQFVKSVWFSQEKSESGEEATVIEIWNDV